MVNGVGAPVEDDNGNLVWTLYNVTGSVKIEVTFTVKELDAAVAPDETNGGDHVIGLKIMEAPAEVKTAAAPSNTESAVGKRMAVVMGVDANWVPAVTAAGVDSNAPVEITKPVITTDTQLTTGMTGDVKWVSYFNMPGEDVSVSVSATNEFAVSVVDEEGNSVAGDSSTAVVTVNDDLTNLSGVTLKTIEGADAAKKEYQLVSVTAGGEPVLNSFCTISGTSVTFTGGKATGDVVITVKVVDKAPETVKLTVTIATAGDPAAPIATVSGLGTADQDGKYDVEQNKTATFSVTPATSGAALSITGTGVSAEQKNDGTYAVSVEIATSAVEVTVAAGGAVQEPAKITFDANSNANVTAPSNVGNAIDEENGTIFNFEIAKDGFVDNSGSKGEKSFTLTVPDGFEVENTITVSGATVTVTAGNNGAYTIKVVLDGAASSAGDTTTIPVKVVKSAS